MGIAVAKPRIGKTRPKPMVKGTSLKAKDVIEGLPFSSAEAIAERMGGTIQWVGEVLNIPPATMGRRKASRSFSIDEGDRVWRLIKVLNRAESVLGDLEKARHWIDHPIPSLGGEIPARMLITTSGYEQVMHVLDSLDYGMGA